MTLRQTHTYAELEVSPGTYDEIAGKLRVAGYDQAFASDGTIDMHGIGLTREAEGGAAAINRKPVFAVIPEGTGDGVPVVMIQIPRLALEEMLKGIGKEFDFTRIGIGAKFIIAGCETNDSGVRLLEKEAARRGVPLLDERRRDFSIFPTKV